MARLSSVVSPTSSTRTPRVLLGRSGSELPFSLLADGIRREGYPVTERESSPVGAHSTGRAAQDVLNNVDIAFLVIREADSADVGGPVKPFQRIIREAGVMQGKMGMDRVVLLVEDSADGLSADTGVSQIRFPPGRPDTVLEEVLDKIKAAFPGKERDLHEREPIPDQARSDALRVPWMLVAVVLFAAAVPLFLAFRALAGNNDEASVETVSVTQVTSVADGLRNRSSFSSAGSAPDPGPPAGPDSEQDDSALGASPGTTVAAGPAPSLGGSNELFPSTCSIEVTRDSLLDDVTECDGAGQLVLDGSAGPWHNDIAALAVDEGVIGELLYEPRGGRAEAVQLTPGTVVLDPAKSSYGVQRLTFRFGANRQHVHLMQDTYRGGAVATLTFTLDE